MERLGSDWFTNYVRWIVIGLLLATGLCLSADLSLHDMQGRKVRLRDYRGKIVVLNFWATWCGPCRHEMPIIGAAAKAWGPKGVVFVAVSLDSKETRQEIPGFMQTAHVDVPVWVGASADDLDKLQLGDGVPDTVFVDEQGAIVERVLGEIRRSELDEGLGWLAGDRRGPAPPALVNHMPSHNR